MFLQFGKYAQSATVEASMLILRLTAMDCQQRTSRIETLKKITSQVSTMFLVPVAEVTESSRLLIGLQWTISLRLTFKTTLTIGFPTSRNVGTKGEWVARVDYKDSTNLLGSVGWLIGLVDCLA